MGFLTESRLLLTGATGLIGGQLLSRLERERIPVRAVSRQQSGTGISGKSIDWFSADLSRPDAIYSQAVRDCRLIVHLARYAHDPSVNEAAYELLNHTVTCRLAQAAAAAGVQHFIFRSSLKVN